MAGIKKAAVSSYRQRMRRRGMVRVEVMLSKADAPLLRSVAGALADPACAGDARALLRQHFARSSSKGLKALLAAAPLDGIDLRRIRDKGRKVAS